MGNWQTIDYDHLIWPHHVRYFIVQYIYLWKILDAYADVFLHAEVFELTKVLNILTLKQLTHKYHSS